MSDDLGWLSRQLEKVLVIVQRVLCWLGFLAAMYIAMRIIQHGLMEVSR
jgi:hypothetical protein